MSEFQWARVGLLLAEGDRYAPYYREAIAHAGLLVEEVLSADSETLKRLDILVCAGYGSLPETVADSLSTWVRLGGRLVCSGGLWGLPGVLGLSEKATHCSTGRLLPKGEHRTWPEGASSVRFFGGTAAAAKSAEALASTDSGEAGLSVRRLGKGQAWFIGPHIGQTMAQMQLGRSVESDGIGPNDGSARLDDGHLRAEDGTVLDFREDRTTVEGSQPFFAHPHADLAKELLIRAILAAADDAGLSALMTWHWPRNLQAAAMMSLECESFEQDRVQKMHTLLAMYGCRAAWLVALPGYPLDVYRALRSWQHEIGTLFVTDDLGGWHEDKLKIQHLAIGRNATSPALSASRPLDGKWRGLTRFYDMAEDAGVRVSLAKGGRQAGTAGFLFGTCQPFHPLKRDGQPYLAAELPYTLFMPGEVATDEVCDTVVSQTLARHGCLHIAARVEAVDLPVCFASIRRLLADCRQAKVDFLLPDEIQRFEKARRALRVGLRQDGAVHLVSEASMEGLTLMASGARAASALRGRPLPVESVRRYGTNFQCVEVDLDPKSAIEVRYQAVEMRAAA